MPSAFAHPVPVVAITLAVLLGALLPTCLYLYVEPRGRLAWGTAGDSPQTRRAPGLVRVAAWSTFALGQLALPWLLIPAACAGLLLLQVKLGLLRPVLSTVTVLLGAMGLVQALLALGFIPLGVKLLSRGAGVWARLRAIARASGVASALVLATSGLLEFGMEAVPGVVPPLLRTALIWTALRPVMVFAVAGVLHALLLDGCARRHGAVDGRSGKEG